MNRLDKTLMQQHKMLSIYLTAGFPKIDDTVALVKQLDQSGVDFIELGMPFSDPMADGPVIQETSSIALANGMTLKKYFEQVKEIRKASQIPLIFMGYYNQILKYGQEKFYAKCQEVGIDALIIPDIPLEIYQKEDGVFAKKYNLRFSFLITPQTNKDRIMEIDNVSDAFIYVVSSNSTTGNNNSNQSEGQKTYFESVKSLQTKHKKIIGFGIHDKISYQNACNYSDGAIIGSAYLKSLTTKTPVQDTKNFIQTIK